MYLIVEFEEGHEVALIPDNWLSGDETVMWPPYKSSIRINSSVLKRESPSDTWSSERISRILYRHESFEKVRSKLKRSEEESDLQTEDELPIIRRKRRAPQWRTDSSSDESDEGPPSTASIPSSPSTPMPPPRITLPTRSAPSPSTSAPCETSTLITTPLIQTPTLGNATVAQVFAAIEQGRQEQREIKRMLQLLISRSAGSINDDTTELPVKFPAKTVEEMGTIDDVLKDPSSMSQVVRHMSMFGGVDLKETVRRFMGEVISTDLSTKYNFCGKKGKLKFSGLQLMTVLFRCIQRHPSLKGLSRKDVEEGVAKWLAGARDRDGGRKKRAQAVRPEEPDNHSD